MSTFHFLLLISTFGLFLIFHKHFNTNLWITLICSLFIMIIIMNPVLCIDSAILGTKLFFYKVFPSLFPFLVISSIIVSFNGIHIYSKIFGLPLCKPLKVPKQCSLAIIISVLCGYPIGAKYCCDLYEKKYIDLKTCQRLLNIASNASPLFLIGAVGTSMLSSPAIGYLLLIANCMSCVIMSFILPAADYINITKEAPVYSEENFGNILKASIDNSIKTSLSIGGFIIIFSVINNYVKSNILFNIALNKISLLLNISKDILQGFFLGLIEMTNGCYLVSSSSTTMYCKVALVSFLISFGGISILSQVYSFTYKYDLSMKKYVFRKFLQGLISAFLSLIMYYLLLIKSTITIFNYNYSSSFSSLITISLILLILPLSIYAIKRLFNVS